MSAKFLSVFEDDGPDLHKQYGCISGLLQVFDRQHLLARRRLGTQSHKALTMGNSVPEPGGCSPKTVLTINRSCNEDHRVPSETSSNSFTSSSCSSSFSSLESSKSLQHESASVLDFRDIVKESIYREAPNLSVRTEAPRETRKVVVKNKDSPRPLPVEKSSDATYTKSSKSRPSVDLDESLSILAKLKGGSWNCSEPGESPRTSFELPKPKEQARFSCDSSGVSRSKNSAKLRETTPRFSLDSRQSSIKEAERRESEQRILRTLSLYQDSGDGRSSPSIVARLMGLEAIPSHGRDEDAGELKRKGTNSLLNCPKAKEECKKDAVPPGPYRKITVENAPWGREEKSQMTMKKQESVYGEIARKLNELEFQQSNKDLRALKQILDAIKAKGLLEANKEEPKSSGALQNGRHVTIQRDPEAPIVIMKPVSSAGRCSSPPAASRSLEALVGLCKARARDTTEGKRSPRSGFGSSGMVQSQKSREKSPCSPRRQQASSEANNKSSGSSSPRIMQQRKLALERKSRAEANRQQQRQNSQPVAESVSPRARPGGSKPRPDRKPESRSRRVGGDMGSLKAQDDELSQRSDSNISSATSHADIEVTSSDQTPKLDFAFFHGSSNMIGKPKNMRHYGEEDHVSAERGATATEQPSPVSVLNASFYQDESPASPADGSSSISCGDDEDRNVVETPCRKHLPTVPHLDEADPGRNGNIASLVQKLQQLSSEDGFASVSGETPESQYISEVLHASGLLRESDLPAFSFRGGLPINPELFLVLEQKISGWSTKTHRRLVFDVVNEALGGKLARRGHGGRSSLLGEVRREVEQLGSVGLRAGGEEEEEAAMARSIVGHEMAREGDGWCGMAEREVDVLVLDVERSLFKELVDEVVATFVGGRACRRRPSM